ncbi:uncharacterized protein LOC9659940 [Selaginella moellendorffii]|uniref:uncharacterized protein LOC9659940 n=1 Tax=Selaginella moellendorffii TaxID=88036 RepID=UPI000D1C3070|nr:uncharacterized protein LOC9659940 [Selaginella moellendorffii]|eukprot:XP_002964804.2 uncharacterized protein LOC9659940 [Selaginella moellendorffii]
MFNSHAVTKFRSVLSSASRKRIRLHESPRQEPLKQLLSPLPVFIPNAHFSRKAFKEAPAKERSPNASGRRQYPEVHSQLRMRNSAARPVEEDELGFEEQAEGEIYVDQPEAYVPVEARFFARSVDLRTLAQEKSLDIAVSRNHLIIRLKDAASSSSPAAEVTGVPTIDCWNDEGYMVIFNYGTAVLFNVAPGKEEEYLKTVKQHSKGVFDEPNRDNYCVVVRPTLDKWSEGSVDRIMVKELDVNSIRVVAVILSQSIALDHYTKQIDAMLKSFDDLNFIMQQTGTFNLQRRELFKLVASVNTALAETILKAGLLERSDVAWQNANYDSIWAFMREEFELEDRFESLEKKTGIIQHNVAFFLDILQNRKSDSLEWIIIVLIAADICVSLYEIFHGT